MRDSDTRKSTSNSSVKYRYRGPDLSTAGKLAAIVGFVLLIWGGVGARVLDGGPYPFSTDAMGHLSRTFTLAQQIEAGNLFARWNPDWYMGSQLYEYYPPGSTFLLAPLAALWSISVAYKILVIAVPIATFVVTYLVIRQRVGFFGAYIAGVGATLSPWLLRTIYSEGHIPVTTLAPLVPLLLMSSILLWESATKIRFVSVVTLFSAAILTHHLVALMILLAIDAGLLLETIVWSKRRLASLWHLIAAQGFALILVSWWLVPALLHLSFPDTPNQGASERIFIYSRSWEIFNFGSRSDLLIAYVGLALPVLAVIGVAMGYRKPWVRVISIVAAIGYIYAFGVNNPLISRIDLMQKLIFFERYLLVATFASAILAGVAITPLARLLARRFKRLDQTEIFIVFAVVMMVLTFDAWPYRGHIRNTDHVDWAEVTESLETAAEHGRFADMVGRPEPSFFIPFAGRSAVYGWSVESTPHAKYFPLLPAAVRSGNGALLDRQLSNWWANGAYVAADDEPTTGILSGIDFSPESDSSPGNPIQAWGRDVATSPVMKYERNSMAVGGAWPTAAGLLPFVELPEDSEYNVDEMLGDQLLLVMAEPSDDLSDAARQATLDWVAEGHDLLILLTGNPDIWTAGLVTEQIDLVGAMEFNSVEGSLTGQMAGVGTIEAPWRVRVPSDDRMASILEIKDEGGLAVPLLSKSTYGEGSFWLLGASSHLLATFEDSDELIKIVVDTLSEEIPGLKTDHKLTGVDVAVFSHKGNDLEAVFDVGDYSGEVLISVTAAPQWRTVTLDGEGIEFSSVENLVVIDVGPGSHELKMRIGETGPSLAVFLFSLLGMGGVASWAYFMPNFGKLSTNKYVTVPSYEAVIVPSIKRVLESMLEFEPAPEDEENPKDKPDKTDKSDG